MVLRKVVWIFLVAGISLMSMISACRTGRTVERTVVVTRIMEVTAEVTREVVVQREVEVTREVPVEVTAIVTAAAEPTTDVLTDTASVEASPVITVPVEGIAASPVGEGAGMAGTTPTPANLATAVVVAGEASGEGAGCWTWQQAAQHVGEAGCVEGAVTNVGQSESAFFINFSFERDSFYAVSFDWLWEELDGECLRLDGAISDYRGRPQIIIDDPSQIRYCGREDGPPAFAR